MTVRETEENIEQIFPELSNLIDIINTGYRWHNF